MAPQREKTFLLPEETDITEESVKSFVDGVLDGTITPKFKVRSITPRLRPYPM
jgi:hypothetical protein